MSWRKRLRDYSSDPTAGMSEEDKTLLLEYGQALIRLIWLPPVITFVCWIVYAIFLRDEVCVVLDHRWMLALWPPNLVHFDQVMHSKQQLSDKCMLFAVLSTFSSLYLLWLFLALTRQFLRFAKSPVLPWKMIRVFVVVVTITIIITSIPYAEKRYSKGYNNINGPIDIVIGFHYLIMPGIFCFSIPVIDQLLRYIFRLFYRKN